MVGPNMKSFLRKIQQFATITLALRLMSITFFGFLLFITMETFIYYLGGSAFDPEKVNLESLIIFSVAGIALVLIPWDKYGLVIKKVGPVEFDQVLSGQAEEHIQEITELRKQIRILSEAQDRLAHEAGLKHETDQSMSTSYAAVADTPSSGQSNQDFGKLHQMILTFLSRNPTTSYSPLSVLNRGQEEPDLADLRHFKVQQVRTALQALVAGDELVTKISRTGKTLYRRAN